MLPHSIANSSVATAHVLLDKESRSQIYKGGRRRECES